MTMPLLSATDVKRHADNIAKDGFSVMPGAIDPAFSREINDELDRLARVRPGGDIPPAPFSGQVTRRWFDLLNDGDIWQRVAIHPWILQVLQPVLGEGFLLSTMGSAVVGDGELAQPIHVDDGVYGFPRPHPNLVCNTMWALTDFTEETGATRVVPGSNTWDADPDMKQRYASIPVEMPAGSIAFVVGSCYHVALTINYCNGSMRQQENLMMSVRPARMLAFARELQDILGFKVCRGAGHMLAQDPREELMRHYGPPDPADPYSEKRNQLHAERRKRRLASQGKDT
jgi:hypothetical protein